MGEIRRLRGFRDIFDEEIEKFRLIENASRKYLTLLGFREVKIPVLERTELFVRSIGTATDIVQKEMFTFVDASGDSVTLRPEATAGMVRAYIEAGLPSKERISKLFTVGPMFRHERPQKGRFREFNQVDVEVFGSRGPYIDAELIWLITLILREINVTDFTIEINSVGCKECRKKFLNVFSGYVSSKMELLCSDCRERASRNPLRIFDCKKDSCLQAISDSPVLSDHLCEECLNHFDGLRTYLRSFGIQFVQNERLVRGLDYYTKTVFEVRSERLGSQNAFVAGGRYDDLVKELGGPDIRGIGFAFGMERVSLLLSRGEEKRLPKVFVAISTEKLLGHVPNLVKILVEAGISTYCDPDARSLKSQMRYANSLNVDYVVIVGEDELKRNELTLRDMKTGTERSISLDLRELIEELRERFTEV